jgi:hypothetical protein
MDGQGLIGIEADVPRRTADKCATGLRLPPRCVTLREGLCMDSGRRRGSGCRGSVCCGICEGLIVGFGELAQVVCQQDVVEGTEDVGLQVVDRRARSLRARRARRRDRWPILDIAVGQAVPQVPADRDGDRLPREPEASKHRGCARRRHRFSLAPALISQRNTAARSPGVTSARWWSCPQGAEHPPRPLRTRRRRTRPPPPPDRLRPARDRHMISRSLLTAGPHEHRPANATLPPQVPAASVAAKSQPPGHHS